jgi:hypothetical protein
MLALFLAMWLGCSGKDAGCPAADPDCTGEPAADCWADVPPEVAIGQGQGAEFSPLGTGATVGLDVAPQGGFGISVRLQTAGLLADDIVDVLLVTELDGEQSGSFLNEGSTLYCQEDGSGLLWGVVVGFDPDVFSSNDDLLALSGQTATLRVTVYDAEGREATGVVDVKIEVGR